MARYAYEDMTVEELEKENQRLMAEKARIREEQKKLHAVLDVKVAEERAKAKFARLSDAEKKALAQVIKAEGIASEESVNG